MFAYLCGGVRAVSFSVDILRCFLAASLLAMAGCSANPQTPTAHISGRPAQIALSDIEDDGLPAQSPPPIGIRDDAVDASEPFSSDYGGVNPSAVRAQRPSFAPPSRDRVSAPALPADLPPAFRKKLLAAVDAPN